MVLEAREELARLVDEAVKLDTSMRDSSDNAIIALTRMVKPALDCWDRTLLWNEFAIKIETSCSDSKKLRATMKRHAEIYGRGRLLGLADLPRIPRIDVLGFIASKKRLCAARLAAAKRMAAAEMAKAAMAIRSEAVVIRMAECPAERLRSTMTSSEKKTDLAFYKNLVEAIAHMERGFRN